MDLNKQTVKALLGVACGSIAFAAALLHLSTVAGAVVWLLGVLAPLLLGCAIAFILNVPMRGLERYLLPHAKKTEKLRRPLALVLTTAAGWPPYCSGGHGHCSRCGGGGYIHRRAGSSGL